jgi:hypothetical protein
MSTFLIRTVFFAAAIAYSAATAAGSTTELRTALADALARYDQQAIKNAVADINNSLGEKQGVPETADQYVRIPAAGAVLTKNEAVSSAIKVAAQIERDKWWRIGLDPTRLSRPLRDPASAIVGLLAFSRTVQAVDLPSTAGGVGASSAGAPSKDTYIAAAREAGDFLLWAQSQAGSGVFPFPAFRGSTNHAAFGSVKGQLSRIEKKGLTDHLKNGWIVEDDGSGGLQFDNGESGAAILALFETTQDKKYLEAALRSAEWAARRPLAVNWNYNAFSVRLLAQAYLVTGNQSFLDSATQKALLGVIPGQLTAGENKGRWADPHNARPTYHYIMMDSLVYLAAAMRKAKTDKGSASDTVANALRFGLIARNRDLLPTGKGASTKETAMLALLNVNRVFAGDDDFLRTTHSRVALEALTKLVSAQCRRGSIPLAPGAWGLFVEHLARN